MRLRHVVALLIFAVSTAAAATQRITPALSFLERKRDTHVWKIWRADTKTSFVLRTSRAKPQNIYWVPSRNLVFYTIGSRIYRRALNNVTSASEQIATLPAQKGRIASMWLDAASGHIRVITMMPLTASDVVTTVSGLSYRLPDGQTIPALRIPSWGSPYIASLWEWRAGEWMLIARRATKNDAAETPGIAILDDLRNEAGVSNAQLLESYTCATGVCRNDVPTVLLQKAPRSFAQSMDPNTISITPAPSTRPAAIFATASGDTVHMIPPVAAVNNAGAVLQLPGLGHDQIGIAFCGSLVLIGEEGSGENPAIFDTESGRRIFSSTGAEATWIPVSRTGCGI